MHVFPISKRSFRCFMADWWPCTDIFAFPSILPSNGESRRTRNVHQNYAQREVLQSHILWSLFSFSKAKSDLLPLSFRQMSSCFRMFIAPFRRMKWFPNSGCVWIVSPKLDERLKRLGWHRDKAQILSPSLFEGLWGTKAQTLNNWLHIINSECQQKKLFT
jgi:hypothetical protein